MTTLHDFAHFNGRHYETGTLHNALAYQGSTAPHTGQPYSEALLLGISGGVALGYFTFEYEGFGLIFTLLTRNTFEPLDIVLNGLNVQYRRKRTANATTAVENIQAALDAGQPPLVWADSLSLPYNAEHRRDDHWSMLPVLVFGVEAEAIHIADRAAVGLTVAPDALADARSRTKTNGHQIMTVRDPDPDRLPAAVTAGIRRCVQLYNAEPPRGPAGNFGFKAFDKWVILLRGSHQDSWRKRFAGGRQLMVALTSAWHSINREGAQGNAARGQYADFLDEAAVILENPNLQASANAFRNSAVAWERFSTALLPDDIPPLADVRALLERIYRLFLEGGSETTAERVALKAEISERIDALDDDFPLDADGRRDFFDGLAAQLMEIKRHELTAMAALREV